MLILTCEKNSVTSLNCTFFRILEHFSQKKNENTTVIYPPEESFCTSSYATSTRAIWCVCFFVHQITRFQIWRRVIWCTKWLYIKLRIFKFEVAKETVWNISYIDLRDFGLRNRINWCQKRFTQFLPRLQVRNHAIWCQSW